eukprot:1180847-Prorocentrum_minimum.AAC.1
MYSTPRGGGEVRTRTRCVFVSNCSLRIPPQRLPFGGPVVSAVQIRAGEADGEGGEPSDRSRPAGGPLPIRPRAPVGLCGLHPHLHPRGAGDGKSGPAGHPARHCGVLRAHRCLRRPRPPPRHSPARQVRPAFARFVRMLGAVVRMLGAVVRMLGDVVRMLGAVVRMLGAVVWMLGAGVDVDPKALKTTKHKEEGRNRRRSSGNEVAVLLSNANSSPIICTRLFGPGLQLTGELVSTLLAQRADRKRSGVSLEGIPGLLSNGTFLLGVVVGAALQASHALYYGFGTITFTLAGGTITKWSIFLAWNSVRFGLSGGVDARCRMRMSPLCRPYVAPAERVVTGS